MPQPKKTQQRPVWGCGNVLSQCHLGSGGIRRRLRRRVLVKEFNLSNMLLALLALALLPCANAQVSTGTGFAVAPGLLVTNHHVIDGCTAIEVVSADGRRRATVVDSDPLIDLALLQVPGMWGGTAKLRSPNNVRLGEPVMVFGFPLSGSLTSGGNFTSGLVSGLRGLRDSVGEIHITAPV